MKHISILVLETAVVEAIADPRYLFTAANEFLRSMGREPLFEVELVGIKKEVKLMDGLVTIHVERQLSEISRTDLVIVPAVGQDLEFALAANADFLPWIVAQHEAGAEVASLCIGAFVLAATGLLEGKRCSTHWLRANDFRAMFPQVELVDGSIITDEAGIYSSGGANSYWSLLLHLLEKYSSREVAILAGKFFAVDIDRDSQNRYMIFRGQRRHHDVAIHRAQDFIESHLEDRLTIDAIAASVALGRRSLERRFKEATQHSILDYIQRLRIEAAKRDLEKGAKQVSEVMYAVGYSDVKAFRDVFKRISGMTPQEYRNKHCRIAYVSGN